MAYRHLSRSIAMQSLYERDFRGLSDDKLKETAERNIREFGPGMEDTEFTKRIIAGTLKNLKNIDKVIGKSAPKFSISQINIIDRNVLRIGVFELLYADKNEVPPKVAINEAVELAKNFSGEASRKFVNGVLGTIYNTLKEKEEKEEKVNNVPLPSEGAKKEKK